MASSQFTRLSLALTGAGTLPEATDAAAALRPVLVFANAWTSERSHRRSSIASLVQFPRL
jgi:hypothetical protein